MGGSSEIAINVVPVIERAGGKVLVRADVKEIVVENGRAVGVTVARKSGTNCIQCSCSGWPKGNRKKLSRSQAQLIQATC